jgi:hypothetical protein
MPPENFDHNVRPTAGDKFPQPRGWALNLEGDAPTPYADQFRPAPRQAGDAMDKFPEPRGWAAHWDGSVLSDLQSWYNGATPAEDTDKA